MNRSSPPTCAGEGAVSMMRALALCLSTLTVASCLPVSSSVRNHDTMVRQYEAEIERGTPDVQVEIASTPDRLELSAESVVSCTREHRRVVKRWRETENTTNTGLHTLA